MAVQYSEENRTITIRTKNTVYQMKEGPCGLLLHTYYGPAADGDLSWSVIGRDRGFSGNPYDAGRDRTVSADVYPMEYPSEGSGDYRHTALSVRLENGPSGCDLRYAGYRVEAGKYGIPGMPAVYADQDEAETLTVFLKDAAGLVEVELKYGILEAEDVITRAALVRNVSGKRVILQNAASLSVDFPGGDWDMLHFHGRHAGERNAERVHVGHAETEIGSRRGASSHQHNPFVVLMEERADEDRGVCLGAAFLYSGSFSAGAEKEQFGSTRLWMGIQPERFDWALEPGEEFHTPEAAMILSCEGLAALSHGFHTLIRRHVVRGYWKDRQRPVLINTWEAMTMDFDREKLLAFAEASARLGVELMVLDDGWFGKRDDDYAGLGDWVPNEKKLGGGIGKLAEEIRSRGIEFGLWIEPEMVNEDSVLYREHPDWALTIPGKDPVRSRYQLVLDFSREEVVSAVFAQLSSVLDACRPVYLKMDMNRSLADVWSQANGCSSQGMVLHKYVLGVYRFLEKLRERYPQMLIEGCAGGGGRFDAGMLYYTPQIWCSDNTDAVNRLTIQYGTSFAYPPETMGAHVSAVPNGDTGRFVPFPTRAVVAMSGTFGYELDPDQLSTEEQEAIPAQIARFRELRGLLHAGDYYRLTDVTKNREYAAWMMVSKDCTEALLNLVVLERWGNSPLVFVRCRGLCPERIYENTATGRRYSGAALMYVGIPLEACFPPGRICPYDGTQVLLRSV